MKTVILAGGLGTRLREETEVKPKPMVDIGGHPILWHIMQIYAAHGMNEFVLALGYKGEIIKNYFLNYYSLSSDFRICLQTGATKMYSPATENWIVDLIDTGARTETGGRIKRLSHLLGNETFLMTYGDGVGNIDITKLIAFHRAHGKLATLTAVRPPARFGSLRFQGDYIDQFLEKPQIGEGWINGGFFVLEPRVLDFIEGDSTIFERAPLERLAAAGELVAYRHEGFWQGMDTLRDVQLLEGMAKEGKELWLRHS